MTDPTPDPAPEPTPDPAGPVIGVYVRPDVPGAAIQFDGSITTLTKIFTSVTGDTKGVYMSLQFAEDGVVSQGTIQGPRVNITFRPGDWIIAPGSPDEPLFAVTDEKFQANWHSG
jgi:hypothetical protein